MIDTLQKTTKQVGLELIDISNALSEEMQTWSDVLVQNPKSVTATLSAGFITKFTNTSGRELTIDVQTPPNEDAVLRTWAIETKIGDDQKEYFNNIQLTFTTESQRAHNLVAKGDAITREDIRQALLNDTTTLARITVSHESGGDGISQTHGKRYDFTIAELQQQPNEIAKVDELLQTVIQIFKKY